MLCLQEGTVIPNTVKVGDEVLLPEYGGTKIVIDKEVIASQCMCEVDRLVKFVGRPPSATPH